MSKRLLYKLSTLLVVTVGVFFGVQISRAAVPEGHDFSVAADYAIYKPGELLVRFAPKAGGEQRSTAEKKQILGSLGGGAVERNFTIVPGLSVVKLPPCLTVKDALKTFNNIDGVLRAEPNYRIYFASTFPNDPNFNKLWGLHNTGQTGGTSDADIDAPLAWDIATNANDVIVAVIDMGVDYNHPDLAANMWINEAEYNGVQGVDDDNNGYIDDIRGWDFSDDNDADPMDYISHGTHCAGTIGAVGDNNEGVTGVCWNVKIMPLALVPEDYWLPGGEPYDWGTWVSRAIFAIQYAVDNGARVLNNSWGAEEYSESLELAIEDTQEKGILFVTIAHNYKKNIEVYPIYPASYDFDNIIAVLATNDLDKKWGLSSWGQTSVDLGAPGADILSTMPTFETPWMKNNKLSTYYHKLNGTSYAGPHVAGAAALIWAVNPYLSYQEVKDILLDTVDHLVDLEDKCVSEGRLNLHKALHRASLYPGSGGFCVKSGSGEPVARFDESGNLFLKGEQLEEAANPIPSGSFIITDSEDDTVAYIDNQGNLWIDGNLSELCGSCNPMGDAFIIRDSSNDNVAYIDFTNGHLCLTGELFEDPD